MENGVRFVPFGIISYFAADLTSCLKKCGMGFMV